MGVTAKAKRVLTSKVWIAVIAILAGPLFAPQLLAFPHQTVSNGNTVYSVSPLNREAIDRVTARANALVAASPLAAPEESRDIFLTDGGWRWKWLALNRSFAQAYSRPWGDFMVVNASDVTNDRIATFVGSRSLSGVIAHETCHGMQYHRFGRFVRERKPQWLIEGYCDHVAAESSLTDAQARAYEAAGEDNMALRYWRGRKRVERELAKNGADVEKLFAAH